MKSSKPVEEIAGNPSRQVQVTSISFHVESSASADGGENELCTVRRHHRSSFRGQQNEEDNADMAIAKKMEMVVLRPVYQVPTTVVDGATAVATSSTDTPLHLRRPIDDRRDALQSLSGDTHDSDCVSAAGNYFSRLNLVPSDRQPALALPSHSGPHRVWLNNAALVAMSLTMSNIWRLPTFIQFNYPGEALIAYVILMTVVGLPLFVMELALGQLARSGIVHLWRGLPLLKGIGVGQLITGVYVAFYYPTLMTWAFAFGVMGIGKWNTCELAANLTRCSCPYSGQNCQHIAIITREEDCFQKQILHTDSDLMNYKLLPMLAVVVILLTLCVSFGVRAMRWVLVVSGTLSAVLLSAALALALVHPNNGNAAANLTALSGIRLLTPTEAHLFGRGEVWYGAMVQTIFSLALGFGTLPSMSYSSPLRRDIIRDGIFVWVVNLGCGIVSVLTVFAWMGVSGFHRSPTVQPNAFLFHIYYHISDSLWSGLAFLLVFLSGVNAMVPIMYAILHNIGEIMPVLKDRHWRPTCTVLMLVLWLINIPGLLPDGHEVVMVWDHFAAGATVLSCLIVHVLGWTWIYRGAGLQHDLELVIGRSISPLWNISWSYVALVLLTVFELWGFFGLPLDGTMDCRYPIWLTAAGWAMYLGALAVAVIIIVMMIIKRLESGLLAKLMASLQPDRSWGPNDPFHHETNLPKTKRDVKDNPLEMAPNI